MMMGTTPLETKVSEFYKATSDRYVPKETL